MWRYDVLDCRNIGHKAIFIGRGRASDNRLAALRIRNPLSRVLGAGFRTGTADQPLRSCRSMLFQQRRTS